MCWFEYLAVPSGADLDVLAKTLGGEHRQLRAEEGPAIRRWLAAEWQLFEFTRGHCACGSCLGERVIYDRPTADDDHDRIDREAERHRKRGWSEARVARWLAEKRAAAERPAVSESEREQQELDDWMRLIPALLAVEGMACFGLLIHFFDDRQHWRHVQPEPSARVRLASLTETMLLNMAPERLFIVRR